MCAFVSRTTRDSNRVGFPQQAGGSLGPGSYDTQNIGGIKVPRPAFTAFGSTTGRSNLGAAGAGATFVTPGPGTYGVPGARTVRREGGRSNAFRSKTRRFRQKVGNGAPGPGSYSVKSSFKVARKKRLPQPSRRDPNKGGGGIGGGGINGTSAPVTWVRVASAPSIPAPSQSYGYEEGQYGELIMQKAPNKGHSGKAGDQAGPGAYNVRTKIGGKGARAVDWARSGTTRTDFTRRSGDAPGPGQYQNNKPQTEHNNEYATMNPMGTSSFASKSSRLSGGGSKQSSRKKREQAPGPGQYRIRGAFVVKHVPEQLQFFGSTQRRFDRKLNVAAIPGPGAYNVTVSHSPRGNSAAIEAG